MDSIYESAKKHWQDGLNLILGLWVIVSPWVLGFTDVQYAPMNAVVIGIVIAVMALWALISFQEWEEWVNIFLGLWLVVTPWLFGFAAMSSAATAGSAYAASWNFVIAGLLVAGLAIWSRHDTRKHGPLAT